MRYRGLKRICLLAAIAALVQTAHAQVRVWQGTLTLPTYEEGAPNPNPPFDEFATTRFNYPYTLRDNLTNHRVDRAWRAVYLENEYLKCSILPDLGGHIYTCIDKLNGQPMFYANPSIKEAEIGYRGGWAAVGVEFNFPVSHNWVTVSPIDFSFAQNKDGSASVTVGNVDRVYGMQWSVELVLRPGSTVLEQKVTLNNRSDVRHRFYWWNNAGVQTWDDSRICYPMRFTAAHGFADIDRWPVDQSGTDLSLLRNHTKGPVSRFVYGSREPFMGVWNPKTDAGVAHFATYADVPAKKIWSWGGDADGLDWRKALSDNNSEYVEVQAGLFRNQETYAFLEPRETIRFSEYWMPVRGLGGIARANLNAVANLSRNGNTLTAALNVNRVLRGASIRVLDGANVLHNETVDLSPAHTWSSAINLPDSTRKYTVELRDADSSLLLHQTEGEYDWTAEADVKLGPQAKYPMPLPAKRTEDDWLQQGKDDELNGRLLVALENYRQGLAIFPDSQSLRVGAGRLASSLLRYDEAVAYLEPAQHRETSNAEIAYYLGLAYDGAGENRKALIAYEAAQRLPRFRAAASLRIGELQARGGQLELAAATLGEAVRSAPDDLRSAEELVAMQFALGRKDAARAMAVEWLARYPNSNFLREQLGQPDEDHLAADADRVLNIAAEYMRLGLYEPAQKVLSRDYPRVPSNQTEPSAALPQNNPLVAYFKGYCKQKLGRTGAQEYAAASKLSTKYVFPSGAMAYEVLRSAVQANPQDATAQYLLGTLQFSLGLTAAGMQHWETAHQLAAKIPSLDASRGLALLQVEGDPEKARAAFQEGTVNDPGNLAIYVGLDQALSLLKRPPAEQVKALDSYPDKAALPAQLVYEFALNRVEAGDFAGATALFQGRFFPRAEGGTNVRQIWVEVQLQQAIALSREGQCEAALSKAAHLGAEVPGLPFTRDGLGPMLGSARTNYLMGRLESRCGQKEAAKARFEQAAQAEGPAQMVWAARAARMLGGYDEAKWHERLASALAQSNASIETSAFTSWWVYNSALLQQELGAPDAAAKAFHDTLLLPDVMMAYHLTRLSDAKPDKD